MAKTRMKSVQLRKCGHFILVPSYQTGDPAAYDEHECQKCSDPNTANVRAKGWKKGRDSAGA